jgi:hypothetical protein
MRVPDIGGSEDVGRLAVEDTVVQEALRGEVGGDGGAPVSAARASATSAPRRAQAARGEEPDGLGGLRSRSRRHRRREPEGRRPQDSPFALGKKSCSPPISKDAIASWPSGEISQSMKACPASVLTWGCISGLTRITP